MMRSIAKQESANMDRCIDIPDDMCDGYDERGDSEELDCIRYVLYRQRRMYAEQEEGVVTNDIRWRAFLNVLGFRRWLKREHNMIFSDLLL